MNVDSIVSSSHPFAVRFRNEVAPFLGSPSYGEILPSPIEFQGYRHLFTADMLTLCACQILPAHLSNDPVILQTWKGVEAMMQGRWADTILNLEEPALIEQDYLALDNALHLQASADMILRWEGKTLIVNFHYLPTADFLAVKTTCAKKKDVYEISAGIFLLNADVGVIVYEDGNDFNLFGVNRSQRLFEAIQKKCRWMHNWMLLRKIPPCRHKRKI